MKYVSSSKHNPNHKVIQFEQLVNNTIFKNFKLDNKSYKQIETFMEDLLSSYINILPEQLDKEILSNMKSVNELIEYFTNKFKRYRNTLQDYTRFSTDSNLYTAHMEVLYLLLFEGNNDSIDIFNPILPTNLSDSEFQEYIHQRIREMDRIEEDLSKLVYQLQILHGEQCKSIQLEEQTTTDKNKIKQLKDYIIKYKDEFIDYENGTLYYNFSKLYRGIVIISESITKDNSYMKLLSINRLLIRAMQYDYIIISHGSEENGKMVMDSIYYQNKRYTDPEELLKEINPDGSKHILLDICNTDHVLLDTKQQYMNHVEYSTHTTATEAVLYQKVSNIDSLLISWYQYVTKRIKEITKLESRYYKLLESYEYILAPKKSILLSLKYHSEYDILTVKNDRIMKTYSDYFLSVSNNFNIVFGLYKRFLYNVRMFINYCRDIHNHTVNENVYLWNYTIGGMLGAGLCETLLPGASPIPFPVKTTQEIQENEKLYSILNLNQIHTKDDVDTAYDFMGQSFISGCYRIKELHKEGDMVNESPILTLQENITFYDTITETTKQNDKLYPVYILLIHSSSVVSKAIKAVTKTRFSHASISFDPTLTRMYSFARKYDSNPFIGTFKVEDIHSEWFTKRDIPYSLYVVPVKKYQMDAMKHRVEYFIRNKSKFKFDAAGLVKNYLGIADNPEYRYFCSRFVSDVLNTGSTKENPYIDEPSLMDPDEFRKTEFATYVCGGFLSDYNPEITKLLTNRILRKERLNQKREENIRTYHAGKVNESTILQNLNPFQTMVENYRLALMTEDAYQEWEDYMSYVKLQYNQEGKLIFTDLQYNQFISISNNAYNTFFNTNDNIIKLDCITKMQYIYQLSIKVILTQDIVITDTTLKELSDFCMTIHTNIRELVQEYQKIDPEFDLLEAYWLSKYYDNGKEIKEVYTTVNGKTAITYIYE